MKNRAGMFFLLCGFTLAGTSVIAARYLSDRVGVFTTAAISLALAVLFLLPFVGYKGLLGIRVLRFADWIELFVQAFFGVFLYRMFLLLGLKQTSASEAGLLIGTSPAITVLLSIAVLKEKLCQRKGLGFALSVAGVFLIQDFSAGKNGIALYHLAGNLLVLGAAASESVFNVYSRKSAMRRHEVNETMLTPLGQTFYVTVIAMALCVIPAAFEQTKIPAVFCDPGTAAALIWYGIPVTALAYIFWYAGIKRCEVTTAAAFSGMVPLTALILSYAILHEKTTSIQWIGGSLILTGMIVIGSVNEKEKERRKAP